MKEIIVTIFLIAVSFYGRSQTKVEIKSGSPFYEEVVQLDSSITKESLYKSAKMSFVKVFKNAKYVTQVDDKELGKLAAKGVLTFNYGSYMNVGNHTEVIQFTIDITMKDNGRFRIRVFDFANRTPSNNYIPISERFGYVGNGLNNKHASFTQMIVLADSGKKYASEALNNFHNEVQALINSIKNNMTVTADDDF
ncbi:DUF4468 domain-containing protein [Niabella insulamsoli]|uniref:DUF4468 domain-containing protein n=1 Tax=Niabella insulamsoli TaxID=3144874 RepID=UPI0031FCD578